MQLVCRKQHYLCAPSVSGWFLRDHPYVTSVKGLEGWVGLENSQLRADVQYYIYDDIVGRWVGYKKYKSILT